MDEEVFKAEVEGSRFGARVGRGCLGRGGAALLREGRATQTGSTRVGDPRYITMPPSTVSTWPVMYFASGAARKATAAAMSSASPNLPNGILLRIASFT